MPSTPIATIAVTMLPPEATPSSGSVQRKPTHATATPNNTQHACMMPFFVSLSYTTPPHQHRYESPGGKGSRIAGGRRTGEMKGLFKERQGGLAEYESHVPRIHACDDNHFPSNPAVRRITNHPLMPFCNRRTPCFSDQHRPPSSRYTNTTQRSRTPSTAGYGAAVHAYEEIRPSQSDKRQYFGQRCNDSPNSCESGYDSY